MFKRIENSLKTLAMRAKFSLLVVIIVSSYMTICSMVAGGVDASDVLLNQSQAENNIVIVEPFDNIADKEIQYASATIPGKNIIFQFKKPTHSILEVSFVYSKIDDDISITIERLIKSSLLAKGPPPGVIYENDNIWVLVINPEYISNATIKFMVEKDWISSNNIDPDNIALYRFKGVWQRLPTERIFINETVIIYAATVPAFSPFAIAGKSLSMPSSMPLSSPDLMPQVIFTSSDILSYSFAAGTIGGSIGFIVITLVISMKRVVIERLL